MENRKKFNELVAHLRMLLQSIPYSDSTYRDMDFILKAFEKYMQVNALEEYSPVLGEVLINYCVQELRVCSSRVARAKIVVAKLNRLQEGYDGEQALWLDQTIKIPLPDELQDALDSYILHCKANGNKETTIHYKRWICGKFLKNIAGLGCTDTKKITGENVQAAFISLKYTRYWERIGPFLRFLYENGLTDRNYSKLILYRKKYPLQPTVYSIDEITAIENSVDRKSPAGIRNYAILLLMTRYGIRSRDVAALTFDDLAFECDRIHFIQQKTGERWECQLFPEVKSALQDYIQNVRPLGVTYQNIFITLVIPHKPLDYAAITTAVWALLKNAGIDLSGRRHGGRALRSSITSNLINEGVPTEIVRKVLGHGTKHAIKSYARFNIENLRLCALEPPVPTGNFASLLSWKEGEE